MTAASDEQLVKVFLASRSEGDFRELYRRHTSVLYRVVWRLLGSDDAEASDVVQEIWLRAGQSLSVFAGRSAFRTWLIGIAVNSCRELVRSRARPQNGMDGTDQAVVSPRANGT